MIPITREELYLAFLNGESNVIPKPVLRKEQYLYQLCLKASGGGLTDEQLQNALGVYFENNPISTNQEVAYYYDSLSSAITDVNNGVWDNANIDINGAKVKVHVNHLGITTVMLLDNISESAAIAINKDIELVLNGHTLSFTASNACLNFGTDTDCTINGEGGSIVKTWEGDVTSSITFLKSVGKKLIIKGGTYSVEGNAVGIHGLNLASCLESEIDGINLIIKNNYTGATTGVRGMTPSSNKCKILYSTISCTSVYISVAVYNNKLNTYIENCTINSTAIANSSNYAFATCVQNSTTGITHVKNSKLLADSPDCHVGSENYSYAIYNLNILYCDNVELNGTHSGISNHGNLYINGGTYTGFCHGGIYFAQLDGYVAYVNDATLKSGNYEGIYDYSTKTEEIYGALYIGGSASATGITAYLDGCTVEHVYGTGHAIVMRGTDGETDNIINISNSRIVNVYDSVIRIDNDTLKLNVGTNTNITESMIDNSSYAEFTEELYRNNSNDKVCDGNDYAAMKVYLDKKIKELQALMNTTA